MMAPRLLLAAVLIGLVPAARGSDEERDAIFEKFDHAFHRRPLERGDKSCVTCHPVGVAITPETPSVERPLMPEDGVCHACHAPGEGDLGAGPGMVQAPHRCVTCHEDVEKPDTHAIGWIDLHGGAAQEGTATCMSCHSRATCTECHDRRQTAGQKFHDRSWLTVHGIAVRADPASCDSCHVQAECISCHASQSGWGRNP